MPRNFFGSDTVESRARASNQIWEARQDQRQEVVDEFETVDDPREVPIGRPGGEGIAPTPEFLDEQLPMEAAARLDEQFPRQDLGAADVRREGQGQGQGQGFNFAPRGDVVRRRAAFSFEEQTPLEDVDPREDLQQTGDGFGLTEPRQRDVAARDLDPQFPAVDIGREDVQQTDNGFGLAPSAEREVAAAELDPQFPAVDLGPGDVTREGGEFGLAPSGERRVAAADLEAQTPLQEVEPDDVTRTDDGFELRDAVIDANRGLFL